MAFDANRDIRIEASEDAPGSYRLRTRGLASPIWEVAGVVAEATATRGGCLMPSALVSLYYEGAAAEGLRRSGPALVTRILTACREEPWRAAWIARETRLAWLAGAPLLEQVGPAHAVHSILSSILADVARCFRAGATDEEIVTRYGAATEEVAGTRVSLEDKLGLFAVWEGEQYVKAMAPE